MRKRRHGTLSLTVDSGRGLELRQLSGLAYQVYDKYEVRKVPRRQSKTGKGKDMFYVLSKQPPRLIVM